jgi:hypothetical protein
MNQAPFFGASDLPAGVGRIDGVGPRMLTPADLLIPGYVRDGRTDRAEMRELALSR